MADWQEAVSRGDRPARRPVPKRHRVMQQGRIVLGPESLLPCIVRDLSPLGASLRLPRPRPLPERFDLIIAGHEIRTLRVRLRWQRADFVGVTFDSEG
ncbi:PilZ domain-containing protein [Methylobacterium flocculans]|uniref:PilZ domain-containing protein n=1 Tax=Methylobacterium flocculans TaxID=2984843 RepID=UPI0021F2795C|nr:PilZ domain-containing protein [Methylobacterium sp. FF17]